MLAGGDLDIIIITIHRRLIFFGNEQSGTKSVVVVEFVDDSTPAQTTVTVAVPLEYMVFSPFCYHVSDIQSRDDSMI